MVTEESLQEQYAQFDTGSLLEVVKNKSGFTEMAISVALKELKKRKVSEEVIRNYQPVLVNKIDPLTKQNCLVDLKVFYKVLFYFVFIPKLRYYFTYDYRPKGYILKLNQSNYYSVVGFSICLISFFIVANSDINFFIPWCLGFAPAYVFDISFNKNRQIENLQKALEQDELPFGY